jgi:hypothetical protein
MSKDVGNDPRHASNIPYVPMRWPFRQLLQERLCWDPLCPPLGMHPVFFPLRRGGVQT